MRNIQQPELSEAGLARRNQMLEELKLSVGENLTRKKRRRIGTAVAVLLTATSLVGWQIVQQPVDGRVGSEQRETFDDRSSNQTNVPPTDSAATDVQQANKPKRLEFRLVSGDEILELLNEVGQPSALAEINSEWVAIPLGKKSLSQ